MNNSYRTYGISYPAKVLRASNLSLLTLLKLYTTKPTDSIIQALWNKGGMRHAAFKKKFKFELSQELKFTQEFKSIKPQKSFFELQEPQFSQQQEQLQRITYFR